MMRNSRPKKPELHSARRISSRNTVSTPYCDCQKPSNAPTKSQLIQRASCASRSASYSGDIAGSGRNELHGERAPVTVSVSERWRVAPERQLLPATSIMGNAAFFAQHDRDCTCGRNRGMLRGGEISARCALDLITLANWRALSGRGRTPFAAGRVPPARERSLQPRQIAAKARRPARAQATPSGRYGRQMLARRSASPRSHPRWP